MRFGSMWVVVSAMLIVAASAQSAEASKYVLDTGWEFRQAESVEPERVSHWKQASVPGDVHTDLLSNGLIADPFYRDNVKQVQWIEKADWEYRKTLRVDTEMLKNSNIDLVFDGLDTTAEVFLNDVAVLRADNMYRQWRVPAKAYLRRGDNMLRVVFPSPIRDAARIAAEDLWRTKSKALTPDKTYLRKAAYEYGWDWGPRLVTTGIWREARLESWNTRISNLHIQQQDISPEVAHVSAQVEIAASVASKVDVRVDYYDQAGTHGVLERDIELHAGINHAEFAIEIVKPHLWYPAGYGEHPLYRFTATVSSATERIDTASARVGLRSITLRRDPDLWGRSFEFVINGIPVFIKGASVIPFDSFPNRVTLESYRRILESARDANMNMVRQWGGGYYESDEFYDLCDELGLMVWQDFMFGNEWQPGTYAFKQNVRQEVEYQVRRLRNHASIVLWCGNNETEASREWPRTVAMAHNDPETARHMWGDYLTLFSGVVAEAVALLDPARPYWPSSPSADYEDTPGDFKMPGMGDIAASQSYMSGDMHNYGIKTPEDYERFFPRFMSEYGWLSFPGTQTLEQFTLAEDRQKITTPVMLAHQDGENGNADILREVRRRYGEPKDLESLTYLSQLAQAEWVRTGAEHLRRNRPRSMGSLFWQLNDCWPAASLSSIDYYGRWKALQYYARRFYAPLLISPHIEDGSLAVYVVSDKTTAVEGMIHLRIMQPDGSVVSEQTRRATVAPLSSAVYVSMTMQDIEQASHGDTNSLIAVTDLQIDNASVSQGLLYLGPASGQQFPKPDIHVRLVDNGGAVTLHLSSQVLARGVYISLAGEDATFSDNYFDLVPYEERVIVVKAGRDIERLRKMLRVTSMNEALATP